MTTTLNTLYPPQVETFMPSFLCNNSAKIWFNISSYDEDKIDLIQYLHVSMVDQRNNQNVFAGKQNSGNNITTVYPQYYPVKFYPDKENNNENSDTKMTGYDPNKKMYWVLIPPQVLKTSSYNINQYYKVQLRFDLTKKNSLSFPANDGYENPTTYFSKISANALQLAAYTTANKDNFSEWSRGTLIKPISEPTLTINNNEISTNSNNPTEFYSSTDVLIFGNISFSNLEDKESLLWYRIQVLKNNNINYYYDSKKIYPINTNSFSHWVDMSLTEENNNYIMRITYETKNGYSPSEPEDFFIRIKPYSNNETNEECNIVFDEENGYIKLNIDQLNHESGYLIIRRASHHSNFKHWDLIAAYSLSIEKSSISIIDDTIESMTGYRYQLQYINGNTIYKPQYVEYNNNDIIHCDFYGGIFSDGNKTLKVTFNFQLSDRSMAANRSKIDTLGGQYPIFTQNPKLKYHIYTINGRISTEDDGELFLPKLDIFGEKYYNYRYNPPKPTSGPDSHNVNSDTEENCQRIKPWEDWLYEREYRDAVEEWLNNGKPKLFRSMTEGNIIVILDGVSMTPDVALGRRLYDFNATMYEIGDGKDFDSITSFGFFKVKDER